MHRREFLSLGPALGPALALTRAQTLLFQISLAEWSFHRALRDGQMEHLDFARVAMRDFGIDAIEYVNVFSWTKPGTAPT